MHQDCPGVRWPKKRWKPEPENSLEARCKNERRAAGPGVRIHVRRAGCSSGNPAEPVVHRSGSRQFRAGGPDLRCRLPGPPHRGSQPRRTGLIGDSFESHFRRRFIACGRWHQGAGDVAPPSGVHTEASTGCCHEFRQVAMTFRRERWFREPFVFAGIVLATGWMIRTRCGRCLCCAESADTLDRCDGSFLHGSSLTQEGPCPDEEGNAG